MRPNRWIRLIARLVGVTRTAPSKADAGPIDPSLLPIDLAECGSAGLRFG